MVGEIVTRRNRLAGEKSSVDDDGHFDPPGGGGGDRVAVAEGGTSSGARQGYVYGDGYTSVKDNDDDDDDDDGNGDGDGAGGPGRKGKDEKGTRGRATTECIYPASTTGFFFSQLWRNATVGSQVLQNRWTVLAAAFWLQVFAGIQYAFPLISPGIKHSLMYDQEDIDLMAAAKDLSCSFKFIAALMLNYLSTPLALVIGASCNVVGFLSLWLAVRHKIEIGFWMLTSAVVIGHQANAVVDVVVMIACVTHFPMKRGVAIGLSKCVLGLSAAMVTQIYRAFFDPDVELFLLILAFVPTCIMLLESPLFQAFSRPDVNDAATTESRFQFIEGAVLALALYLLTVTFTEEDWITSKFAKRVSTCVMLIIFCLPLLAPLIHGKPSSSDASQDKEICHKRKEHPVGGKGAGEEQDISVRTLWQDDAVDTTPLLRKVSEEEENVKLPDMTPLESLCSLSFWLLLLSAGIGIGSGVVIINNLSQLVEALGGKSAGTDLSLLSSVNGLGRMLTGLASETLLHKYGVPRSTCLCIAITGQALSLLLAAFSTYDVLYLVSILAGFSYGALWTLIPALTSEILGVTHFGTSYGLVISFPFGTYSMAYVTGMWYDYQARAQHHDTGSSSSELTCRGSQCFRGAFLICFAMSAFGLACSLLLAHRTRGVYRNIVIHQRRAMRASGERLR